MNKEEMKMKDYIKQMLKNQYTIHVLIAGIIFMLVSIFACREIFTYLAFICFFTVFDVAGYGNMIAMPSANGDERWFDQTILVPYRIMQNMFMVIIFMVVYFYTNWICLLACILGWWMGGCDLLYYILLRIEIREEDYYWMKGWSVWIVITYVKRLFLVDEYISRTEFIIVCTLGLIIGGAINFVNLEILKSLF
jgi:hypothetical protein